MPRGVGLCECGCGLPTQRASRNRPEREQVKGELLRFVNGHNLNMLDVVVCPQCGFQTLPGPLRTHLRRAHPVSSSSSQMT